MYERYDGQEVLDAEVGNGEFFLFDDGCHTSLRFCLHAGRRVACSDFVVVDHSRRRCVAVTEGGDGSKRKRRRRVLVRFFAFLYSLERKKKGSNFDRPLSE